jgi:hypothetical protein
MPPNDRLILLMALDGERSEPLVGMMNHGASRTAAA